MNEYIDSFEIKVETEEKDLFAYITIIPPVIKEKELRREDIEESLRAAGVKYGIDETIVERIIKEEAYNLKLKIAEGKRPENGISAYIEYLIPTEKRFVAPSENNHGKIDYRDFTPIAYAKKGQLLAKKYPPTIGVPGMNVRGHEIPAQPGKDTPLSKGPNTDIFADGMELRSTIDGHAIIRGRAIIVEPVLKVDAVNYHTGNINFDGSVIVSGSVWDGFSIKAKDNIEVQGTVGKSKLESGSNITINGGVIGGNKANITAKGDIKAKFIDNSTVESGRNVIVSEYILHSDVISGGKVILIGTRGTIVGSTVKARDEISVVNVGNKKFESKTVLEVGRMTQHRLSLKEIETEIKEERENYRRISKNIRILENKLNRLPQEQQELFENMKLAHQALREKIHGFIEEGKAIKKAIAGTIEGKINVFGTLYPEVRVIMGGNVYSINDMLYKVTFILHKGEFRKIYN